MNPLEALRMAGGAIRGNVLRSFLTALGVIIGVATVIATVSLGQGSKAQITSQIEALGTNLITVFGNPRAGAKFTAGMAADLARQAPDIVASSPAFLGSTTVAVGTQSAQTQLIGVGGTGMQMRGAHVAEGAFFTADDVANYASVAVLGQTVVRNLGLGPGAVGQQIIVGGRPMTVVGILQPLGGGSGGQNQDDVVVVPYTAAEIILGTTQPQELLFEVRSAADAPLAVGTLQAVLEQIFPRPNAVFVQSQDQLLSTLSQATQTLTVTLGAIAGVSLLVGGIGIMNIMLVSVTERTREIGLRKAVGAKRAAVLQQFLMEAAILSGGGGLVGVAAGMGGSRLLSLYLHAPTLVTPTSAVIGFGFSVAVGLVFGYWPAIRGSRLDPIVALRHD